MWARIKSMLRKSVGGSNPNAQKLVEPISSGVDFREDSRQLVRMLDVVLERYDDDDDPQGLDDEQLHGGGASHEQIQQQQQRQRNDAVIRELKQNLKKQLPERAPSSASGEAIDNGENRSAAATTYPESRQRRPSLAVVEGQGVDDELNNDSAGDSGSGSDSIASASSMLTGDGTNVGQNSRRCRRRRRQRSFAHLHGGNESSQQSLNGANLDKIHKEIAAFVKVLTRRVGATPKVIRKENGGTDLGSGSTAARRDLKDDVVVGAASASGAATGPTAAITTATAAAEIAERV